MNFLKNLKFVRKIQTGFLLLGAVSSIILVMNYFQIEKINKVKDATFNDYVIPQAKINRVYGDFQKVQSLMMEFSIEAFAPQMNENLKEYEKLKKQIDSAITDLLNANLNKTVHENLVEVQAVWKKYKEEAGDAIISAALTMSYDMAAVIAVSTGEEFSKKMIQKLDVIEEGLDKTAANLSDTASDAFSDTIIIISIGAVLGAVIFLFCAFILAPAITKPIDYLKEIVKEFSLGNYEVEIKPGNKDEIGELTNHISILQRAQKEKIAAAQNIADGKMEKVTPASDKDVLAHAFNREIDSIEALLNEFNNLVAANNNGDLEARGNSENFSGGWSEILEGANSIIDSFTTPINEAASVLEILAKGDLSAKMKGEYKGAYQNIKENINMLALSLSSAIAEVAQNITNTTNAANQIFVSTEEMAAGAQEQSAQTAEVAAAVEQMASTLIETTRNAGTAAENARKAGSIAEQGGKVVERTVEGMEKIAEVVISSAATVKKLGKSSDQIGEIVQVIDDIADQTNLLALNAAIEAARAGEQGRGFAVVADEVRKLAERTTKATREIADMIRQIQKETGEAVESMEKGTEEVSRGKELARQAGESLKEIINASEKVVNDVTHVAAASEQQSATAEQISKNVEAISSVTHQSAAGTQQVAQAAGDLNRLTEKLQKMISKFKIDETASVDGYSVRHNGKLVHSESSYNSI